MHERKTAFACARILEHQPAVRAAPARLVHGTLSHKANTALRLAPTRLAERSANTLAARLGLSRPNEKTLGLVPQICAAAVARRDWIVLRIVWNALGV